jgi:hypothetical protein
MKFKVIYKVTLVQEFQGWIDAEDIDEAVIEIEENEDSALKDFECISDDIYGTPHDFQIVGEVNPDNQWEVINRLKENRIVKTKSEE